MGDVAGHDHWTVKHHASLHGVLGELGADLVHWPVEIDVDHIVVEIIVGDLGQILRRIGLKLLKEDAVFGDLAERLAVGRATYGHRYRTAGAVAWQTNDAHVVTEILAAELSADAGVLRELEHLCFKLDIAKRVTGLTAAGGQAVEVLGASDLRGLYRELGRRAADDYGKVIRRACSSAEGLHLFEQPWQQGLLVEQRLGLLKQVALVGAAATLGDEQELVSVAIDCADLDLGGQVVAGVHFVVHIQRRHLAVAQVTGEVGVEHTAGDGLFVAATGEYVLALLGLHDCSARVLAHRQHAAGGDVCVLEQIERNEAVVAAGLWVVEDAGQLLEMGGP
ncbi:unannotated protein [freshwater metagenome]|uniref:Unannotated protein n=1 Tax=freshwater metagenome TaxID=449393 RepID=A0A6J6YW77_9ZZZZ